MGRKKKTVVEEKCRLTPYKTPEQKKLEADLSEALGGPKILEERLKEIVANDIKNGDDGVNGSIIKCQNVQEAYLNFLKNPTKENKDLVAKMYYAIPEEERCFCMGDQDAKDSEIKFILTAPEEELQNYLREMKHRMTGDVEGWKPTTYKEGKKQTDNMPCAAFEPFAGVESLEHINIKDKLDNIDAAIEFVLRDYAVGFKEVDVYSDNAFLSSCSSKDVFYIFRIALRVLLDPRCVNLVPYKFYCKLFWTLLKKPFTKKPFMKRKRAKRAN